MSRNTDKFLSLTQRTQLANEYGADIFVSIHNNAASNLTANGIETFYHTDKSSYNMLAYEIQTNAINYTGAKNRGVKSADFAVIRESIMPSALFEGGFMTNKSELKNLCDSVYQNKLAEAIADGIETYLIENVKLNSVESSIEKNNKYGIVNTSSLNVRSGPGINYSIIDKLVHGTKVNILDGNDGWYKINYDNKIGFTSSSYINILEGWLQENGKWYYYNEGECCKDWIYSNKAWYYLKSNGEMAVGWQKVDGKWYYLGKNGAMLTGWQKIDGDWYYLKSSGEMATGWQKTDGNWYYLKTNGEMAVGWQKVDEKWYYLGRNGAMLTGWQKIDGDWYYLYSSGEMAKNTIIDGWEINNNGVAKLIK